ncbi:MAG: hypothetical protein WBE13_19595 [Candidatus Acidiferrum sp.]
MADLNIDAMHQRHRALTDSLAGSYREAASVCLSRHHSPPVQVSISDNASDSVANLVWPVPDTRTLHAWANEIDATEAGAYACVIAAVELLRNLFAVRRAETKTGADYYIGPKDSGEGDLDKCLRLEISGLNDGSQTEVARRLLQKVEQALRGSSNLPALAGVIGFASKKLMIRDVPENS